MVRIYAGAADLARLALREQGCLAASRPHLEVLV